MKRCLDVICIVLVLLFFPHCGREKTQQMERQGSETHAALAEIDSLMWRQPDSAFVLLQEFVVSPEVEELDTFDGHYCQVLISELLYKNDFEQTNRTELLQAVAYFDSLMQVPKPAVAEHGRSVEGPSNRIAFLSARAHYINGVGYYENDSLVPACAEYLKTLEIMESHFEEKEMVGHKARFMAYTYNRLGDMFSEQFMMEPAIASYKNSYKYSLISSISSYSISNAMYRIGKQFAMIGDIDSASFYYSQAIANMPDSANLYYRNTISNQALLSYQLTHQAESSIQRLKQMILMTEDQNERLVRYLVIGDIYFEERQYDSAQLYLKSVFENTDDAVTQMQAAEYLRILYDSLGEKEESGYYIHYLAMHKPMEHDTDAKISNLSGLFRNYLEEKAKQQSEKEKHEERKQAIRKTIRILIPLALFVVAFIILLTRNKHNKNILQFEMELKAKQKEAQHKMEETERKHKADLAKQEEIKRKALEEAEKLHEQSLLQQRTETETLLEQKDRQLEKEKKARQREKERLQQGLRQREEQVNALEKVLNQQREEAELRREAFLKETICCKINDSVRSLYITAREGSRKNVTLTKEDSDALRDAVLRHYENFESFLLSKNPKMNKDDIQLCQLYLLGLDERQIAVLQCKTYSAIKKRAAVLKGSMGIVESLSAYILKFSTFVEAS